MAIIPGVGYLIANDILSDVSYALIQNPVNTVVPTGGISTGSQTVLVWDDSMYVGAMILVGAGRRFGSGDDHRRQPASILHGNLRERTYSR